jgi:hypothetical protein
VRGNKSDVLEKGFAGPFFFVLFQVFDGVVHNGHRGFIPGTFLRQRDLHTILPKVTGPEVPAVFGPVRPVKAHIAMAYLPANGNLPDNVPFARMIVTVPVLLQYGWKPSGGNGVYRVNRNTHSWNGIGKDLVWVESGKEGSAGGPAPTCIVKIGKTKAIGCQGIDVRSFEDLGPVAAQIGMSHIIHQDKDQVGPFRFACTGSGQQKDQQADKQAGISLAHGLVLYCFTIICQ